MREEVRVLESLPKVNMTAKLKAIYEQGVLRLDEPPLPDGTQVDVTVVHKEDSRQRSAG
jgi:predicted DNA-binding antitoxin AbrB/MazE fold protein